MSALKEFHQKAKVDTLKHVAFMVAVSAFILIINWLAGG